MNKVLIISLMLILVGCDIDPITKARQDQVCERRGGVYDYRGPLSKTVQCRDGGYIEWRGVILKKKFYPVKEGL